jgi:hypothetical protein
MLPAIAASASINSGTPSTAIRTYSRLCASAIRPGPSAWIIQELATRLRSGIRIPPPIDPEKVDSTSVAPDITNQVLISWLLATSPRSWVSSRRFCVGSSVLSVVSVSSAMVFRLSFQRYQVVHGAEEIIEERSHHRGAHHRQRSHRSGACMVNSGLRRAAVDGTAPRGGLIDPCAFLPRMLR